MGSIHEGRNGVFAKGLVNVLSCNIALELPRYRDEVDKKPAQ
jgi:hypothetical protein